MKLKKVKKLNYEEPKEQKSEKKSKKNSLPPAGYTPMFEPKRILVRETRSYRDGSLIKQYLEISVKRIDGEEHDEAMPFVWVQMYQESAFYTGYLKGKTVYMPLEALYEFIDAVTEVSDECDEKGIK